MNCTSSVKKSIEVWWWLPKASSWGANCSGNLTKNECKYIFRLVDILLTLWGFEKIWNVFKLTHPIFKVINDVCCTIVPPWKMKSFKENKRGTELPWHSSPWWVYVNFTTDVHISYYILLHFQVLLFRTKCAFITRSEIKIIVCLFFLTYVHLQMTWWDGSSLNCSDATFRNGRNAFGQNWFPLYTAGIVHVLISKNMKHRDDDSPGSKMLKPWQEYQ